MLHSLTEKVAQSCPTLCDPMGCIVHGILQARILEWLAFPFYRESSQPRDRTQVSLIAGGFFTSWATREATIPLRNLKFFSNIDSFKNCKSLVSALFFYLLAIITRIALHYKDVSFTAITHFKIVYLMTLVAP